MPLAELLRKIDDAHEGLKGVAASVRPGASRQRYRVHYLRNALAQMPGAAQALVAAPIRTVFAEPDLKHLFPRVVTSAPFNGALGQQRST